MRIFYLLSLLLLASFTDFAEVCGVYSGEKDDYVTELKLYDDSVFKYTAIREFPFEVSEGQWTMKGDTVILNTTPCQDPEALKHTPVRTYVTFIQRKFLFKKNTLIPIDPSNKLIKDEVLHKEK